MPDSIQPVGAMVNADPNQAFTSLNNILGIQGKRQALQIQGQQLQQQTMATQKQSAYQNFFTNFDPFDHLDPNTGITDMDSVKKSAGYRQAGPARDLIDQKLQAIQNGQIQNKSALLGLNKDQRAAAAQSVGDLATDPDVVAGNDAGKAKVKERLTAIGATMGDGAQKMAQTFVPLVDKAKPGDLAKAVRGFQIQAMDTGSQVGLQTPTLQGVQGKNGFNYVNTNPNAPQPVGSTVGQPVTDQGLTPSVTTAPNGQLGVVGPNGSLAPLGARNPSGTPVGSPSPGQQAPPQKIRTAQDDAPGMNATDLQRKQYADSATAAQHEVDQARETDKGYGNSIAISKAIRHLAPDADSGPGKDTLNKFLAGFGTQTGTNNQELGAFLDRQAATLRTQMGLPGTNAGAEDSKQIAGHTGYTKQAIMDKNDYTQALVEGAHQYRNGLDRVEGFSGQANPKAVNAFKNAWTNNFDPNVYKLDIAKEQGPEAFKKFINSLDPKEAASLSQKRKNLQTLANGQIPQ